VGSDPVIAHYDISAVVTVVLTDSARDLLDRIRAQRSGALSLVIGNGCCDSTAPFLFEAYVAGPNEARVGEVAGDVEVLLDRALLGLFEGREIVIDAADAAGGPGEDSFSCESELGMRFSLDRLPQPS
jgi:uncharacterized protein (DUF779 family)